MLELLAQVRCSLLICSSTHCGVRCLPASTTYLTSGRVMDVSAILVARRIRRVSDGTFSNAVLRELEFSECSKTTLYLDEPGKSEPPKVDSCSNSSTSKISLQPGRKASMEPLEVLRRSCDILAATRCRENN